MAQSKLERVSNHDAELWRLVFLIIGLLTVLFLPASRVVGAEGSYWRSDFKAALQEAEAKKLPILIHFYADWCGPCKRMDKEVFSSSAIQETLGRRYVAVKVNSDQRQDLVKRYGIETLPSDLIIDSLNGRIISLTSGYQDQSKYLNLVGLCESKFHKAHANDLVVTKSVPTDNSATPAVGVKPDKSADGSKLDEIELGDAVPMVGLEGYSPVALTKGRQWNRGSPAHSWDYKDLTYYFSTREEMIEFRNNPEAYAPKLLGCDPVILWESDRAVAGDIRYGAFFDDELYLFKTEERRRQFKANPEKYIRLQHAVKVDQIERTVIR